MKYFLSLLFIVFCFSSQAQNPPEARQEAFQDVSHDRLREDPYKWMEYTSDELLDYAAQENAYTESVTKDLKNLQTELYDEMLARIDETDESAPMQMGDFFYYHRTEKGKPFPIYCRKPKEGKNKEQIILDLNELANDSRYFDLGILKISPNHKLLAFSVDSVGYEEYTLQIKNLETGEIYPDKIPATAGHFAWSNDNQHFFYSVFNENHEIYRVLQHKIGREHWKNPIVFDGTEAGLFVKPYKTKSGKYIIFRAEGSWANGYYYMDADDPTEQFQELLPFVEANVLTIEHHDDYFYMLQRGANKDYNVLRCRIDELIEKKWTIIVADQDDFSIENFEVHQDYIVLWMRKNGLPAIRVINTNNRSRYDIDFPDAIYGIGKGSSHPFENNMIRFSYSTPTKPQEEFDFNLETKERISIKKYKTIPNFNPADYIVERQFAKSKDGTLIPISIAYKKGLKKDGNNPAYLYAYGCYGISIDPDFDSDRLSLLDRGFVFAIAHVRGGGEYGDHWRQDAYKTKRKNTFDDFIACSEFLINEGYTSGKKLGIEGESAGGLLIGVAVNQRPDLYQAAIADVPLVDIVTFMLDKKSLSSRFHYSVYGDPQYSGAYQDLLAYAPMDNMKKQAYPNMLILGGMYDARVRYYHAIKYTARLRDYHAGAEKILLKMNMDAGHFGSADRYKYLEERAFKYAFLIEKTK